MYSPIENGTNITVQGLSVWLPPIGYGCDIDTGDVQPVEIIKIDEDPKKQKWKRQHLPKEYEGWLLDEKNKQEHDKTYSNYEYEKYRQKEWHRRLYGIWYYINGVPVYIPGAYYFFLNWWMLQKGYPEYRIVDLHYFYFWQYCVEDPVSHGMIQMTKRRGAKTVKAACILFERVSRTLSAKGGIQSKKKDPDAREFFTLHVVSPFQYLPEFFLPVYDTMKGTKPETKLSFFATSVRGKNSTDNLQNDQLKSEIDFRESEAMAYDGTSLLVLICDERGKVDFDLIEAHLLVRKCGIDLRGNIIGKMIVCTTVEEIGIRARFPELWRISNQYTRPSNEVPTESGLYRFFTAADEAGDWDEYGIPYTGKNRARIKDSRKLLEGDNKALIAEIRKDPLDEREAFMIVNDTCHFDALLLNDLYERAKVNEKDVIDYGNLQWVNGMPFTKAEWVSCSKEHARFRKPKGFKLPEEETVRWYGAACEPINTTQFISACDPFQNNVTEDTVNSKASAGVLNRFEPGTNDDFYNRMFVLKYHARPATAELLHMDMAMMCFTFGCQIGVENVRDGGMIKFFEDNGMVAFLIHLPNKENPGLYPDQNNKALLVNLWEHYIEHEGRGGKLIYADVIDDDQDGLVKFNINDTERSNQVMGLGWTLVADYYKKANFRKKASVNITDYFPKYA